MPDTLVLDSPATASEVPVTIRPEVHELLDKYLCIDEAAAEIQRWSDKIRKSPERQWEALAPASKELYRLLCYRLIWQLVGSDPWDLLDAVDKVLDKIRTVSKQEGA